MVADLLGLLLYTIGIYPLVLLLLAIRLNRYRPQVDHYFRRVAGLAFGSSFYVVFSTVMFGGLLFIPWVLLVSFLNVSDNILVLLGPPICASFLFSLGWLMKTANGEYLGLPKENSDDSNDTPNNSFNRSAS